MVVLLEEEGGEVETEEHIAEKKVDAKENCFKCGDADNWISECPKNDSVCTCCGGTSHIKRICCKKINGAARGRKSGGSGMRGGMV